jgi:hypothetical protein
MSSQSIVLMQRLPDIRDKWSDGYQGRYRNTSYSHAFPVKSTDHSDVTKLLTSSATSGPKPSSG